MNQSRPIVDRSGEALLSSPELSTNLGLSRSDSLSVKSATVDPPPKIWLVIEDSDDDFWLLRRACAISLSKMPIIHWERDGVAAQTFLMDNPSVSGLVICDINMPLMDGLKFLEWLRNQPQLNKLSFVFLTSSNLEQDKKEANRLGVDRFFVKPSDVRTLGLLMRELDGLT